MATTNTLDQEQPERRKFTALQPHAMSFEDARIVRHCVFVPRDTPPEDLLESGLWTALAHRIQANDLITCLWEDKSQIATLLCLEASPIWTSMHMLSYSKLPGIISDNTESLLINYEIFFSQSDKGYNARRLSDSVLIVRGSKSRQSCIDELMAHPAFKMGD